MCFSFFKKKEETVIPANIVLEITRNDFINTLRDRYNIEPISLSNPLDSSLKLTTKEELDRVAPDLVYPADWYVDELWDCEEYGLQAQLDAGRKFKFSARLCLGDMDLGYHGFLMTLDSDLNLWLLEPNAGFPYAGMWFKSGENGYLSKKVFI
jgi:hypothetical protein